MNIICKCGKVYSISIPKIEANLDVNIYTDGVVEGGGVPRDIKIFKCTSCGEYKYIAQCEKTIEEGDTLAEPTSEEYLELIKSREFDTAGIRVKAWQRSNDSYRDLDSLEDIGVKIELLKIKIAEIPSVTHFDEYITKMKNKLDEILSTTQVEILIEKIEELKIRKAEILERLQEKKYLKELEAKQDSMAITGEAEISYSPSEIRNMEHLLDELEDDGAGLLLKAELYRNLGMFDKSIEACNKITEKHYANILNAIKDLSLKKLKKVTFLRD